MSVDFGTSKTMIMSTHPSFQSRVAVDNVSLLVRDIDKVAGANGSSVFASTFRSIIRGDFIDADINPLESDFLS